WPAGVKFLLVVGLTTVLGLASYQTLVRHTFLGTWLHGPRPRPVPQAHPADPPSIDFAALPACSCSRHNPLFPDSLSHRLDPTDDPLGRFMEDAPSQGEFTDATGSTVATPSGPLSAGGGQCRRLHAG